MNRSSFLKVTLLCFRCSFIGNNRWIFAILFRYICFFLICWNLVFIIASFVLNISTFSFYFFLERSQIRVLTGLRQTKHRNVPNHSWNHHHPVCCSSVSLREIFLEGKAAVFFLLEWAYTLEVLAYKMNRVVGPLRWLRTISEGRSDSEKVEKASSSNCAVSASVAPAWLLKRAGRLEKRHQRALRYWEGIFKWTITLASFYIFG